MRTRHVEQLFQDDPAGHSRRQVAFALLGVALLPPTTLFAQAPPPPPPPGRVVRHSALLPTSADVITAIRRRVDLSADNATALNDIVSASIDRQRGLLASFGIDPAYDLRDVRISGRDGRALLDELDDLVDTLETKADRILSARQYSVFRDIVRQEQAKQRDAIRDLIR